jgi:adenylylsulfate kinase-like enzyme
MIYWLTGQSGAGNTTIANELLKSDKLNRPFLVDGDRLRELFNNKDYSETGRRNNVLLAQSIAETIHKMGRDVLVALVSPYRDQREQFKEHIGEDIKELYIHTTRITEKENFHVNKYEEPLNNFVDIDTSDITVEQACKIALN